MRKALIIWLVLLTALCLAPVHVKHRLKTDGRLHGVGHVLAFFITSSLLLWRARRWPARAALMLVAFGLAYATEYSETAIYHNSLEWSDVRRDGYGIVFGFLFASLRMDAIHSPLHSDESGSALARNDG
jgi:hypothetical protein